MHKTSNKDIKSQKSNDKSYSSKSRQLTHPQWGDSLANKQRNQDILERYEIERN